MFLILGNISGNAVAFGIYIMIAAGKDPIYDSSNNYHKSAVIGLAVATLTVCAGLHIFTRRGGILVNNAFAVVKVAMVFALAILGFIHAGGRYLKSEGINEMAIPYQPAGIPNITSFDINEAPSHNLNIHTSFHTNRSDIASYVDSFLFVLFTYTGFEQPFYVLSEVARPRKVFPTYTILGMVIATVLYALVNVSYFCVVPKEVYTQTPSNSINMAGAFLHYLFDSSSGPDTAKRVMAGLIAISVFGNILVMTFTAARVKQEIAKEGILPWSLFFATGHTTPWAWLRSRMGHGTERPRSSTIEGFSLEDQLEKSPMAALALHWFTSVLLVLVTAPLKPVTAYSFLTSLYSYVNLNVVGFLVSGGLVYLKLDSFFRGEHGRNWANKASYIPWISPLHAIIYLAATGFFLFATFARPSSDSTFAKKMQGYAWYLLPTIGLSSLLWGVFWWLGLKTIERNRRRKLVVTRTPYIERDDDGSYVQKAELVEHEWLTVVKSDIESDVSEKTYERFAKT
jgi:amino acid transporter